MAEKIFNPEKYGMVFCPCCNSHGYVQNPERQCCPKCGGFGFVKKKQKGGVNISSSHHKFSAVSWSEQEE
jgi:DnaJ-class molecular chaperone